MIVEREIDRADMNKKPIYGIMKMWLGMLCLLTVFGSGCSSDEAEDMRRMLDNPGTPPRSRKFTGNTTDVEITSIKLEANKAIVEFESREDIIDAGEGFSSCQNRDAPPALFYFDKGDDEARAEIMLTPKTDFVVVWLELENGQCVEVVLEFSGRLNKQPWLEYLNVLTTPNPEAARLVKPLFGEIYALTRNKHRAAESEAYSGQPSILPIVKGKCVLTEVLLALPVEYVRYDVNSPQVLARMSSRDYKSQPMFRGTLIEKTINKRTGKVISVKTEDIGGHETVRTAYSWSLTDLTPPLWKEISGDESGELKHNSHLSMEETAALMVKIVNAYWDGNP